MAGRIAKVRWAAHGREMSSHLSSIYSNLSAESDCVIASEGGRRFPAHRVVLAMASPFFSRIFATMTPDVVNPLIVLDGVEADHVEALMQYMYSGYSIVKCEKLPGLCRTAKILCIKEFPSLEMAPSVKRHTDDRAEVVEVTDEKNSIPRSSLERRLEADKYQMFHAPRRDQGTDKTFQPDFKKIKTCLDETRQPLEMNQRTERRAMNQSNFQRDHLASDPTTFQKRSDFPSSWQQNSKKYNDPIEKSFTHSNASPNQNGNNVQMFSPRPSYGKPLSEFSLLTAPLAGESKLREALRVPVTAAQSTSQSVETKDIKQEDPPELVDVCSVSDDEAVKDRLACDSSTSTTIAPPATKKPDQLSVASSSTALREVRAFGKILPSSTSFKSARGSSGAITRSVSPPPIQSPLGGTSTRPSSLPPDVNCLTSNSTQTPPVQRPNNTQTTSAQRPNRTQTPPVQRPNSTQTPSAQRPNSTQTPLAQHPNYNQEPRATEHFHNSHVLVPQVVQVPIPRRYAAISTPQYLPPVNVVSSHRNSYETQESFGYPRPGYPDRRRSIGDSPYVQEGFYRQGSLIPSRTPGVRAADDHIKVDYELRRNANAYKDRSSASSVKVVNVDHLKTDQSLMRRSNSFSSRNGWPSSYSQSTSIERLRYATACSITPICTTKISTPKVQKVYTKNMTVRNMSAETGVEIIQVDESPRPMPPTPTDETSSNSSSSFPVPDSSVRRQNTNLEERPVISASQSTSPQSSDSVYSWRPLEVDESRAEFSENSGSSPEGVTNDPLLTKISSTKRRRVRGPRSWEYLLRLLRDPSTNPSLIRWENESEGIFRLVKPDAIALRWGKRTGKHFTEMLSYENFARGLRYHYVTGALSAVSERCFVYKFGPKAEHALQYPERISDNIVGTHSDESNN